MTKEKFLTKEWNNWLTIGLGVPTLIYAIVVLSSPTMSDFVSFIVMVLLGATY